MCLLATRAAQPGTSTWKTYQRVVRVAGRAARATWNTARRACWPTTAAASGASCPSRSPGCRTRATWARAGAARSRTTAPSTCASGTVAATGSSPRDGRASCRSQHD